MIQQRMKMKHICQKLNLTRQTIWSYMHQGKLRYHQDKPRSHRYFYFNEVLQDLGITPKEEEKITIAYCRVSTKSQEQDLISQNKLAELYCSSKGYNFKLINDIGSGINYNKKGLNELIELIIENKVNKLILVYKDRLLRFGNELIFNLCEKFNVEVEIINKTENITKEQELVENVLEIITVFASKLYGQRSHKTKNIIKQNKELWKS